MNMINTSLLKTVRSVPEEFRGIGIRIEDDILITDSGKCIYYSEELYKIGQDFLDIQYTRSHKRS